MDSKFIKFRPDNFTTQTRTPWAGHRIAQFLKADLNLSLPTHIGESWEFSTSSELPSFCRGEFNGTFADFLNMPRMASSWLSSAHRHVWGTQSPLLVKYIDAAYDLSLQLHPPIEASDLSPGQSGKWESWLILAHNSDSGIYLGLAPHVTIDDFIQTIQRGDDLKPLLHFVPVATGELYTIPPCTIHALGAGVCALEPQLMQPGKKALSLRLHDWNRKYDENGNLFPYGVPRPLHLDEALNYIDINAPRGKELETRCRTIPTVTYSSNSLRIVDYSQKPFLMARIISGTGTCSNIMHGELTFISVMQSTAEITVEGEVFQLRTGESGAIAASAREVIITAHNAKIYMAHCLPECYHDCANHRL